MKKLMVSLFLLSSCLFSCGNVKKIGFLKANTIYVCTEPSIAGYKDGVWYYKSATTKFYKTYTIKEATDTKITFEDCFTDIEKAPEDSEYDFSWGYYWYKEDKEHIYTFNDFKKLL